MQGASHPPLYPESRREAKREPGRSPKPTDGQCVDSSPSPIFGKLFRRRFLPFRGRRAVSVVPLRESHDDCTVAVEARRHSVSDLKQTISRRLKVPLQLLEVKKDGYEVNDDDPIRSADDDMPVMFDITLDSHRDLIKHLGDLPLDDPKTVQFLIKKVQREDWRKWFYSSAPTGYKAYALKARKGVRRDTTPSSTKANMAITYTAVTNYNLQRIVNKGYVAKDNYSYNEGDVGIHSTPDFDLVSGMARTFEFQGYKYELFLVHYVDKEKVEIQHKWGDHVLFFHRDPSSLDPFALLIHKM